MTRGRGARRLERAAMIVVAPALVCSVLCGGATAHAQRTEPAVDESTDGLEPEAAVGEDDTDGGAAQTTEASEPPDDRGFEEPDAERGAPIVPPGGVPPIAGPTPTPTAQPVEPTPEEAPEPIPPPSYDVALHFRLTVPPGSGFDTALAAHRYDTSSVVPVAYVGAAAAVVEWLWLGGRLGMRGRTYGHPDRDEATLFATDLLVTAQLRFALGRVVELGALVAGGAAYIAARVNDVLTDQVTARFGIEATVAFRIGRHFALGPRVGWDYFQWENMNAHGHGLDLGGASFGVALEGRE